MNLGSSDERRRSSMNRGSAAHRCVLQGGARVSKQRRGAQRAVLTRPPLCDPALTGSRWGAHRQARDFGAGFPCGDADVVSALKIEPELAAGTEPMSQTQR